MEIVTGIRLRDIFIDNGNWWKLFIKHRECLRWSIIVNVIKMLTCRTGLLGYHTYVCPDCNHTFKAPHSCKSRFCSSCGKRATDDWIKNSFNTLPDTTWQHITFTMPSMFWEFFWMNRNLMNKIPSIAARIILTLSQQQGFYPGIYLAIHTFGRDLKRNMHIHLSTTAGGLALPDKAKWVKKCYFFHKSLKSMWRYEIITLLRKEYKSGQLKLTPNLRHIKDYYAFNSWLDQFYQKTWNVHLKEQSNNLKENVEYLGRYLKRPPIGETRITDYDGISVTYEYLDHYTQETKTMSLPALIFIANLITHIPDRYFRNIRYYGFLANRIRGKYLPLVNHLLQKTGQTAQKVYTTWRSMIRKTFGYDPIKCPECGARMALESIVFTRKFKNIIPLHKQIAHGYFQLL